MSKRSRNEPSVVQGHFVDEPTVPCQDCARLLTPDHFVPRRTQSQHGISSYCNDCLADRRAHPHSTKDERRERVLSRLQMREVGS